VVLTVLRVENVTVRFDGKEALTEASLDVADGEIVTVLGPSGSGKSTLMRVIAGLQAPDEGRVVLDGVDLTAVPPHRRGVGLVFQDHALFPHRDVLGNVSFGLRMRGDPPEAIAARTVELLELVGLAGFERRSVGTLSGGEQQRVALARALAPAPRLLLLDEPLGSLDRRLRDRLLDDLSQLFDQLDVTAVYVTHDQTEAFTLGDRVAVMRTGRVVQTASPDELWAHPLDEDVARFLGIANVSGAEVIRPEAVTVRRAVGSGNGVVERAVRVGPLVRLRVRLDEGRVLEAVVASVEHPASGERVDVEIDPDGMIRLR
jgi:thiamine transport system ATP-binding protein